MVGNANSEDDLTGSAASSVPADTLGIGFAWVIVELAPDGILVSDDGGRIMMVNRQVEDLFGYDHDTLIGTNVESLLPARLRRAHETHRANYEAAPALRPMGVGLELLGCRSDGSEFPIEVSLSPAATEHGIATVVVIRDVTEQRALEQPPDRVSSRPRGTDRGRFARPGHRPLVRVRSDPRQCSRSPAPRRSRRRTTPRRHRRARHRRPRDPQHGLRTPRTRFRCRTSHLTDEYTFAASACARRTRRRPRSWRRTGALTFTRFRSTGCRATCSDAGSAWCGSSRRAGRRDDPDRRRRSHPRPVSLCIRVTSSSIMSATPPVSVSTPMSRPSSYTIANSPSVPERPPTITTMSEVRMFTTSRPMSPEPVYTSRSNPSTGDPNRCTCSVSDKAGEIPTTNPPTRVAPSTAAYENPGHAPVTSVHPDSAIAAPAAAPAQRHLDRAHRSQTPSHQSQAAVAPTPHLPPPDSSTSRPPTI